MKLTNNPFRDFEKEFKEKYQDDIDEFIDEVEYNKTLHFNYELITNRDKESYDSYGNEDSSLSRIIFFKDYGILVEFYGTRRSYNGPEWDGFREVKKVTKTIEVYE